MLPLDNVRNIDESPILMIDRGTCTFVTKVRNVEIAGGVVAIIVNSNEQEDIHKVVMADDGRGLEVSIPGLLVSYKDGNILKDYYKLYKDDEEHLKKIVLEVNFEMEHPSNTVRYDLYFVSDNEQAYKLLKDFYVYHQQLDKQTNLTVHYVTYQSPTYDSQNKIDDYPHCLGSGKYCNTPGKLNTLDGRIVVLENVKQKCVYKYAYQEVNNTKLYWDYMISFYKNCIDRAIPEFTKECSAISSLAAKLPMDSINKCISESWIASADTRKIDNFELFAENKLLDQDNEDRRTFALTFIPSLLVNNRTFWGSWTSDNLVEAICAGFKKKPELCYSQGAFQRPKMSWYSVTAIVIIIILLNAVIFYFCKNYIRRKINERIDSTDINSKINIVVSDYLALRDNNTTKANI